MTKPTILDRVISYFSPQAGVQRAKNRIAIEALSGGYHGGSRSRDALVGWNTGGQDADSDILTDLPVLRERSRDLVRNNAIAAGAIHAKVTNVIGTGLKLNASIDRDYLGLSDEEADNWEAAAEREFNLWAKSQDSDIERTLNFPEHQELAFRSVLENGDHFVILAKARDKAIYGTALQHVEADRVSNPDNKPDTATLAGGVERTMNGEVKKYHISDKHPGSRGAVGLTWSAVPAFGEQTGRRVTLHLYRKIRSGQTRGVPDLAPVIESIKQLGRYTEAEIDAAVKTAMFALLVKTETGDGLAGLDLASWKTTRKEYYNTSPVDLKGGSSTVLGLFPDDEVSAFDPNRPNSSAEPFIKAFLVQIGMALELPVEVLTKHFQSSYSAARAALVQMWLFIVGRRRWLADNFCQPIYETILSEAIAKGRLSAPGFFTDPRVRAAYCGSEWIGDAQGQIDETKAVSAARDRIELGVSHLKRETAALTGEDWDKVNRQRQKEIRQTPEKEESDEKSD